MQIDLPKIFISPSNYIQAKNILFNADPYLSRYGSKAVIVGDENVYGLVGDRFIDYLKDNDYTVTKLMFGGEASPEEIQKAIDEIKDTPDFVIGIGGGKTLDTAKEIGQHLNIYTVIIPTLASTDAPISRLSVLYNEDGTFNAYQFHTKSPDLVLVDPAVISQAPPRFLASGFGDALSTYVEAKAVGDIHGFTNAQGIGTITAMKIAQASTDTIFEFGAQAFEANKAKVVTPALEAVIEANILMSGLGFESGGTSLAHALQNSFPALKKSKHLMHGEKVAYSLLTQLLMENAETEVINHYLHFFLQVGLPTTLEDLGWEDATDDELMLVANDAAAAWTGIDQLRFDTSPEAIVAAMRAVDQYSKDYQAHALAE
ncbi:MULTISPECIES: glycerol dehydrogenase [Lacticaseibacillus]|uniref:glycerol dehydrogenase n=1 Tax=Lacticaseibacillus TaxID=2759736 RepID=UPI00069B8D2E|nr:MULTISPECIES: glycerol dehydrogenase [Lacticaseibacillus]